MTAAVVSDSGCVFCAGETGQGLLGQADAPVSGTFRFFAPICEPCAGGITMLAAALGPDIARWRVAEVTAEMGVAELTPEAAAVVREAEARGRALMRGA